MNRIKIFSLRSWYRYARRLRDESTNYNAYIFRRITQVTSFDIQIRRIVVICVSVYSDTTVDI